MKIKRKNTIRQHSRKLINMERSVASAFEIEYQDLFIDENKQASDARSIAWYIAYIHMGYSQTEIAGRYKRTQSAVSHSMSRVANNNELKKCIDELLDKEN